MSGLVVDASIVLAWLLDDEGTQVALAVRQEVVAKGALVPVIWRAEVANALLAASRRGRITLAGCIESLEDLALMRIEPDGDGWDRAWSTAVTLAHKHRLTLYDATYLELALRRGLPLATFDSELRKAAAAEGVELL